MNPSSSTTPPDGVAEETRIAALTAELERTRIARAARDAEIARLRVEIAQRDVELAYIRRALEPLRDLRLRGLVAVQRWASLGYRLARQRLSRVARYTSTWRRPG